MIRALFLIGLLFTPSLTAQTVAIQGGEVHTLNGDPIANATVVIEDGRITAVGVNVPVPAGAEIIDATGLQVFPGLFDAQSQLGLTEIGQVPVTRDFLELGQFNPHLVASTAVHPASEYLPVALANGITHTVAMPAGRTGGIGGQGSLFNLSGWTIEEMLVAPSVGFSVTWPTLQTRRFNFAEGRVDNVPYREAKREYDEGVDQLTDWLDQARRYAQAEQADGVTRDLRLEALAKATSGELPLIVRVNNARGIRDVVDFGVDQGLRVVIAGGAEAWRVTDILVEHDIPVILGPTQSLPSQQDDGYDQPNATPRMLVEAGVRFAIATFNASASRNLPYEAANAVSYGLAWEDAMRAVTVNAAEILGVSEHLGTLEVGKIGNIIVTDGDPLEITTDIRHILVNGQVVNGDDNKHERLYQKYRARPTR